MLARRLPGPGLPGAARSRSTTVPAAAPGQGGAAAAAEPGLSAHRQQAAPGRRSGRHVTGLVDLSPEASLEHEKPDDLWFSVPEAHFAPYLVGGRIEPRGLFWDFHSADGTLPPGASQLLVVARTPNNVSTAFEINACISVAAIGGSPSERREILLELPPYAQAVEPPAR